MEKACQRFSTAFVLKGQGCNLGGREAIETRGFLLKVIKVY